MSNRAISEDLSIEILKRLPIKTLCRFRCVCKSWNSTISSSFFINLHLSRSTCTAPSSHKKSYLLSVRTMYNPIHHPYLTDLTYPFKPNSNNSSFRLIDVIHGVLCVSYSTSIILWNPSIHKYISLPTPIQEKNPFYSYTSTCFGFGFDSSNNDFKVIGVCNEYRSAPQITVSCQVYSSREGLWRRNKNGCGDIHTDYGLKSCTFGCFFNGCMYWILSTPEEIQESEVSALMFDCAEEVFKEVELPEEADRMMKYSVSFAKYADKLVVVMYMVYQKSFKVWRMMEDNSWIKLTAIYDADLPNHRWSYGVLMLVEDDADHDVIKLQRWDLQDKKFGIGHCSAERLHQQPMGRSVFEETTFLMDLPNCKSYNNEDTVFI